ncbi:hypothetical protein Pen01_72870 [Phytomonospora endophytica]|nr:hypothetical protein Pen01_72870 [Phytomonospora endophytica]
MPALPTRTSTRELGDRAVDDRAQVTGVGGFGAQGEGAGAAVAEGRGEGLGAVFRGGVGDDDVGAVVGESAGDGGADAAASTGDEGDHGTPIGTDSASA